MSESALERVEQLAKRRGIYTAAYVRKNHPRVYKAIVLAAPRSTRISRSLRLSESPNPP